MKMNKNLTKKINSFIWALLVLLPFVYMFFVLCFTCLNKNFSGSYNSIFNDVLNTINSDYLTLIDSTPLNQLNLGFKHLVNVFGFELTPMIVLLVNYFTYLILMVFFRIVFSLILFLPDLLDSKGV